MREITGRWIAWARGLRRRWSCRRTSPVSLGLVWLRLGHGMRAEQTPRSAPRPLMLRLSIAPSIAIQWASRIRAAAHHVTTARELNAGTAMARSLAAHRAASARILNDGLVGSAWNRLKPVSSNGSSRSLARTMAPPGTLPTSRRVNGRGSQVLGSRRGPVDALVTFTLRTRMPADASRRVTVPMTSGHTRIEPRVLAPPPMVGRMPSRTTVSSVSRARPNAHDSQSPLGFAMDERSGWMPIPGALSAALAPGVLDSVTDHVVREIDSRVRARRERLGKV